MQLRRREVDAEFKILSQLTPLSHQELFTWGLTHFNFLDHAWIRDTADHLESYIMADPGDRYSRLALAAIRLKSPDTASRVEGILKPLPRSDPEAAALRIELKLEYGQTDEAAAMLSETPADDRHLARIRGRIAMLRGDHAAAIRQFRDALSDEPYDRVSPSELGKALLLTGEKAAAERYFAQAKRLNTLYDLLNQLRRPDRENEHSDLMRLGQACEASGLFEEARGWYLLVITRNPLDAQGQQALHRLRQAGAP
jgi:tetratricopeptide (TPR) repeat protein